LLVGALDKFYLAEDYHQKYYLQNSHIADKLNLPKDANELANSYLATRLNGYVSGHGSYEDLQSDLKKLDLAEDVKTSLQEIMERKKPRKCVS
jgi:peptide-methionine (S)-S-oxide reductase